MDLREVIAKNIAALRTEAKMTQLALAELLNYSDKAISKWERGESVPDVIMLKKIADHFGVTVDYLLTEDHTDPSLIKAASPSPSRRNRVLVSFLAVSLVWLIATLGFVTMVLIGRETATPAWMLFIYAIPTSAVVTLVFNSIWGKRKLNYLIISVLVWTLILAVYMTFLTAMDTDLWIIFILGIPAEVIILLWSGLKNKKSRTPKKARKAKE